MGHKRPPVVTQARMVLSHHVLIMVNKTLPIPVQIKRVLDKNLVHPPLFLRKQHVYQGRLIVCLERRPALQMSCQDLTRFIADRALGPHWSPNVQQIQRPLAVADQEAASVQSNP
ncbi:calcium-dependent lipid-binding family protein [Striga asiatica]|uniref:Calcium-dependent lipid-binding family protein n=1 Tax=Striga asiatica TaxID=4170 RepID=A0A5A7Q9P1_STRAF|nr:calcium-dependent lipid-binding family protein [Striga asiatica]